MDVVSLSSRTLHPRLFLIMDSYRFIVFVENHLCKIFGFYSPWARNLKSAPSTLCKIYYFVILFVPFVVFYLSKPRTLDDRGVIVPMLVKSLTVTLLFEIYFLVYKHNIFSRNLKDFYSAFFANDASTQSMLKSTNVSDCNYRRELMLCLLNIAMLVPGLIFFYHEFSFLRLFLTVRHLLVLPIKLQWALCVHHIDNQINRIKKLMKSTLELDDCNSGHISSRLEVYHGKRINLVKVDSVIRVYRMLAEKRMNLNEHYGTYIALHVHVMIYHLVLGTFRIWFNAARNLTSALNYFLMIRLLFIVIDSVLLFSICETANKKVKYPSRIINTIRL